MVNLVVEKLYEDTKIDDRTHPCSSGVDLYVHRIIEWYTTEDNALNYCNYHMTDASGVKSGKVVFKELPESVVIDPLERVFVGTGIKAQMVASDDNMRELQIRSRSGTFKKMGLDVAWGTVDYDYTGELYIVITNTSPIPVEICVGEKYAQMVPAVIDRYIQTYGVVVERGTRGSDGFHSTGL